jgi:hypothetical protein
MTLEIINIVLNTENNVDGRKIPLSLIIKEEGKEKA